MANAEFSFLVKPKDVDEVFEDFQHKSPFNLESCIKNYRKKHKINDESQFFAMLSQEIESAYKHIKKSDYIYHNMVFYNVVIVKFRMGDKNENKGTSDGHRVVALVDEINKIFYLLYLYKHSEGKDDLTPSEKTELKQLCDEYASKYKNSLC